MSSAWGKSWGGSWASSWGAVVAPVVEVPKDAGRFAGEWLPIPVPKKYQHALPPKRKVKVHATGPAPRASATARVINPVHFSARLVVYDGPVYEITCRVDTSIVDEEDFIIAALAAQL
jgi:hypothetical protein